MGDGMYDNAKTKATGQWDALMMIPGIVARNWPSFFTFAIVEYIEGAIIMNIPPLSGGLGVIATAGIRGATRVVNHSTWQATQNVRRANIKTAEDAADASQTNTGS